MGSEMCIRDSLDGDNIPNFRDLDSDGDGCFDVIEAGYEDVDNDGLAGESPIFYDPSSATSSADERGRVVYSGYDFNTQPLDNDNNTIYDFQEAGTPATLTEDFAASNAVLCEGETLYLTFKSSDAEIVFWEVDSDLDGIGDNSDIFPNDSEEWLDDDNDGLGNNIYVDI